MVLDQLRLPIVLAPLAGGPSTPRLAAAVSEAGGLGFLAAGYLPATELAARLAEVRSLTDSPIGVNLFVPGGGPTEPGAYGGFLERLGEWAARAGVELAEPRFSDDDWQAKLDLLLAEPVPVVSFTFGCPESSVLDAVKRTGSETWVTVTSSEEAEHVEAAGADCLVVQGAEAGGHRGSFVDRPGLPTYGLLPLIALIQESVALPMVASGGIATGSAVAAVLCAGARAAQLGTAFMLAPEAGTSDAHREALRQPGETGLTRAFTGRLARGIKNRFMAEHDSSAPIAYPEVHYVTAPMRRDAREAGNADGINLWAGEAHQLALERPASEIVAQLGTDAQAALDRAAVLLRAPRTGD